MPKRSLGHNKNDQRKNDPPNNDAKKIEQLNRALDALLARSDDRPAKVDASIDPLLRVAAALRSLPREEFKTRLKSELIQGRKTMSAVAEPVASVHVSASPRLTFKNAAKAMDFYKQAFGAKEIMRFDVGGHIPHAEIKVGDSTIMLTEEWPEGNRFSPETLGNSPVMMSVDVPEVDKFFAHAISAGAETVIPIADQFYGRREGTLRDPFGYLWSVSTMTEEMPVEEMHRRMNAMMKGDAASRKPAVSPIPRGFHTVTPYMVATDGDAMLAFAKNAFGADETFRTTGGAGGIHAETRIGDTMLMMGGGLAGKPFNAKPHTAALHIYVHDTDAAYKKALQAGASSISEPQDHEYGERGAGVKDPFGNHWYIATRKGATYKWEGAPDVQAYLHPLRAEPVIGFLRRAFGAEELGRHTAPDGVIHHLMLKIGTSYMEMGEAHGPYQPMQSMFYLYVPNCDAVYQRALAAGAKSTQEPADQPYGDRTSAVIDPFGNTWYITTHVKDTAT
jgi:PhnB protein